MAKKKKMGKCPACGYQFSRMNRSFELRQLYWDISDKDKFLSTQLKKTARLIRKHIPSDNNEEYEYQLIKGLTIDDIDGLKWSLNWYLKEKTYLQAKGFNYLKSLIRNHLKDRKILLKSELRRLGKSPKNISNKRKELGYD